MRVQVRNRTRIRQVPKSDPYPTRGIRGYEYDFKYDGCGLEYD